LASAAAYDRSTFTGLPTCIGLRTTAGAHLAEISARPRPCGPERIGSGRQQARLGGRPGRPTPKATGKHGRIDVGRQYLRAPLPAAARSTVNVIARASSPHRPAMNNDWGLQIRRSTPL
jgi:hypothetical protein